jgi:hypothetical protein
VPLVNVDHCTSESADTILSVNGVQIIRTSEEVTPHMKECPAIAELMTGKITGEKSLFTPPEGQTHVTPKSMIYKHLESGVLKWEELSDENESDEENERSDERKGAEERRETKRRRSPDDNDLETAATALLSLYEDRKKRRKVGDGKDNKGSRKGVTWKPNISFLRSVVDSATKQSRTEERKGVEEERKKEGRAGKNQ